MPASTDQVEMSGAAFVPVCVKVHGSSPPRKRWGDTSFNRQLPKQFPGAPVRRPGVNRRVFLCGWAFKVLSSVSFPSRAWGSDGPVCTGNLNPDVVVVKSAEDRT